MAEPKLRFPEFKDSWELHNLGDFAKEIKRVEKDSEAPVMMISSGNGFIYQADRYSRDNAGSSLKKYIELHKDEFAYNHGYSKAKIYGSVFMLTEEEKARIPYVYHCFSIDNAHKPFLARLLNRNQLNKELVKYITSTARMDGLLNISFEDFMKVEFFIPSEEEQRKVADTLIAVDELISTLTEEVRLWEEKKKGVMQKIFSQEIRFKDENGEDYPEWEEKTLGDLGTVKMCKRVLKEQTSNVGDIPFYKIGTFGGTPDAYISRELYIELREKYSFPRKGDILLSAAGTIGRTVVYDGEDAFFQDSNIVWLEHNELIKSDFLYQFYKRTNWENLEGGTIKRLYNGLLLAKEILLPCLEEQQKIADCLASIDEVITIKKQKLETWKNIKKGLLQQMFV